MQFIPQVLLILFGPFVLVFLLKKVKAGNILSPVVLAYVIGILAVTFGLIPLDSEISKKGSELSIMIAIPLLLFSSDIVAWFKHARSTVISFFLAIIAAIISCVVVAFAFHNHVETVWDYSAMLAGVYTGGTANMQAVGIAINAPDDSFVLLNAVEIVCGGLYLLFLTSVAPFLFGKVLPEYKYSEEEKIVEQEVITVKNWKTILLAIGLAVLVLAMTLGGLELLPEAYRTTTLIIVILTSLSVAASFFRPVRELSGAFEAGDYLLLVFCVAVGMRSDFANILDHGLMLLLFTACSWILCVTIHLILSIIFKIDRDTTLITSTAALYGPAFIGQIASVLKNRQIVFAGIATGLVGYSIGNYLGIGIHYFLYNWFAN